jgi:hypothetical protein
MGDETFCEIGLQTAFWTEVLLSNDSWWSPEQILMCAAKQVYQVGHGFITSSTMNENLYQEE